MQNGIVGGIPNSLAVLKHREIHITIGLRCDDRIGLIPLVQFSKPK
jgi:hypothetical protein